MKILEVIEKRRCTRSEALAAVKDRSSGYASAVVRGSATVDASLVDVIASAIEKSQSKMMERYLHAMAELLTAHTARITESVSALCGVAVQTDLAGGFNTKAAGSLNQQPLDEIDLAHSPSRLSQPSPSPAASANSSSQSQGGGTSLPPKVVAGLPSGRPSSAVRRASKAASGVPISCPASNSRPANENNVVSEIHPENMECQSVAYKRMGSPISGSPDLCPKQKTKKGQASPKTGDILEAAVAAITSP